MNRRLKATLLAVPILLDCAANKFVGGSFNNTLSASAWRSREHKWWGWTHQAIDNVAEIVFQQKHHCEGASNTEYAFGSRWAAWWYDITTG